MTNEIQEARERKESSKWEDSSARAVQIYLLWFGTHRIFGEYEIIVGTFYVCVCVFASNNHIFHVLTFVKSKCRVQAFVIASRLSWFYVKYWCIL